MHFGAHESVAGGLHTAFVRAQADGCRALQIFTKNSGMWREPYLTESDVAAFRDARAGFDGKVMAHTSYLINLASAEGTLVAQSQDALVWEMERCSGLGIDYCVLHPGAHLGAGEEAGVSRVVEALSVVHERTRGMRARILLENTAGQGSCVGHRFEHLARILRETDQAERLGVCLDTQHLYAAGYDLATREGYARTFEELDRQIGVSRVLAFHLNDSNKPLGSRVDRHEHVGEGLLGLPTFWRLANDPRFADLPGVIEIEPRSETTPYAHDVRVLSSLVGAPEPAAKPAVFALEVQDATTSSSKRRSSSRRR